MKRKKSPASYISNAGEQTRRDRVRIDVLLVERGLAPSRERAQALLMAGRVRVNGQKVDKTGTRVAEDSRVEVAGEAQRYVSRGGMKLEGALEDFGVSVGPKVCIDVGSSTGGFTDCLLQNGASKVYAIDVTTGQLDWKLQNDKRVITVEKNARFLHPGDIAEPASLIVLDVSFISVTKILPATVALAAPGCDFLVLIKPQFELQRADIGKGGIVRDPALHRKAMETVVQSAAELGLEIDGVKASRLSGSQGNQEFFLHAVRSRVA